MPVFSYEAVDSGGKKVSGTIDAAGEFEAREKLRSDRLMPLTVGVKKEFRGLASLERVTQVDVLTFTRQLGGLLEAGVPVDRALMILSKMSEKKTIREILATVLQDIQGGQALSQALSKHKPFPKLYINMVRAGEAGGVLEPIIEKLANFLETSIAFREDIRTALIYPIFLTIVGGVAVGVMMIFVVPKFASIFLDLGQSLPASTQMLMAASDVIARYWWMGLGVAAGMFIMLRMYAKTDEGRMLLDSYKLKVPVMRDLHIKVAVARFCRTLSTMIASGVPILQGIRIAREVTGNEVMSRGLAGMEESVSRGKGLSGALRDDSVFPPLVAQMVAVGEESGRLEETLMHVAVRYEEESRRTLKRLVGMLEPAIILVMALVVGFIVISMLVTIFSIYEIPM
ncbi:MAG: type II secretion system F family protein [Nitrospirae bacterium]|nr:type II secretion system F family protein [Nitrospirota bacterium]